MMHIKTKRVMFLTLLVIFLAGISYFAHAVSETATATISENNPQVYSVTLRDSADSTSPTAIDPATEYLLKINATDNNSLDDLSSLKVVLYYAKSGTYRGTANSTRELYTYIWTESSSGTTGTWSSANGANYIDEPDASTSPADTSAERSYIFKLYFKLNRTAMPSGTSKTWIAEVTAYDDDGGIYNYSSSRTFDVNKYSDFSASSGTINYGTLNPNSNTAGNGYIKLTDNTITFTVTSNMQANLTVAGHNLTNAYSGTGLGGEGSNWKVRANQCWVVNTTTRGGQGNKTFDETAQLIYKSINATQDSLDTSVKGYNAAASIPVQFGGKAVNVIKNLAYSGTYTVALALGNTPA